ncbi:dipeptide ABC transporter ATP-binding protein [Paeniglutamicibacter cryotolerans]|uniref:Peptide/nickel transport system ATP-binding protein n=1 Tax=Paeniglutamicibacter cryotolerans TaxID=670079 RepID=A0A839QGG0_9MICC|nr:ABC transporter ATP-binding protein [Paeniglutamicibacter cryotolerans]MBB2994787.1 peptide/nickel transport system ATP-binding protein [Paeniglutamicibacter cryotolerans]
MISGDDLLRVENLNVSFGNTQVVHGVGLQLKRGETLALVGESGSGKSVTARSLIGLAGSGSRVLADALELEGRDLRTLGNSGWRTLRGTRAGYVSQDALGSLDPLRSIGREIEDSLRLHTKLGARARAARVLELLEAVGLDEPALRAGQRSGELSGGMRQRALIAAAVAMNPPLLIADEPTTALDATIQAQIMELLAQLCSAGTGLLLISHDLAVVASVADRIAVMSAGRIVEQGPTAQVLGTPSHAYTRALLRAVPSGQPRGTLLSAASERIEVNTPIPAPTAPVPEDAEVLRASDLHKSFRRPDGSRFEAVRGVSLSLAAGKTLGLVGESGSGKTTTARLVLALETPDAGSVRLFGAQWSSLPEATRRPLRPRVGAVYQDPQASFDPRLSVGQLLTDALSGGKTRRPGPWRAETAALLELVGLDPTLASSNPRTLSGGQRQRVAIARALAPKPELLICDEPVSALDVSVQAQILDLLDELQQRLGLSCLFISHDLAVVRHMSDTVAVMRGGRILEQGCTEAVFTAPVHPYTRDLLAASPTLSP